MKENDLMLNILVNPTMSLTDFKSVGLTADNIGLSSEDNYKNNPIVQQNFTKDDGTFDDSKFHNYYLGVQTLYNNFSQEQANEDILKQVSYHRDNIFAPQDQRRQGPETKLTKILNPNRQQISTTTLGVKNNPTKSVEEIAQSQRILLNPVAVEKGEKAEWSDVIGNGILSSGFWNNLFDTQVLAQWDYDADINGKKTDDPDKIVYHKGEYKLNDDGTYYYEALDGRDVYGRRVLNKANILTSEDSWINKYDFFDSDDIAQKSGVGNIMKQLALVGSMFIPYVGNVVTGLSIVKQGAGLFATLGKMLTGSENPTLSAIEGWVQSTNFQNAKTEEAQNNTWCWENFIGMIGESIGQIREQRVLFEKFPALIKGKAGMTKEGQELMEKNLLDKYNETSQKAAAKLIEEGDFGKLAHAGEFGVINKLRAQNEVANYMKSYNKIGEILSKTYMTGITVAGTYGEAKQQGASDEEAMWLTLGYGAAEAALLNTGVGEWLYPELKGEGLHQKAVAKALVSAKKETENLNKKLTAEVLKRGEKEARKEYGKRLFQIGRDTFRDLWGNIGNKTFKSALASGLGEGVEEVAEELLADFSKTCFNYVNKLRGDDTFISTNLYDEEGNLTIDNALSNYAMNFMGGFVGGGISSYSIDNLKYMKSLKNMDKNQAMQEVIYMVRNNKHHDFLKAVDKMTIGDKNLGTKPTILDSGEIIWNQGTPSDNQDIAAKKAIKQQIKLVEDIMNSNGLKISDDSFLKGQTDIIQDLKFTYLQNSTTAGRFLQEFNNLSAQIIELTEDLRNSTESTKSDSSKRKEELDKTDVPKEATDEGAIKAKREKLKELIKQKDALLKGERAAEFISDALFEMTPMISGTFIAPTFNRWVEYKTGKKIYELSEKELNKEKAAYENWVNNEKKDDVHTTAQIFYDIVRNSSQTVSAHADAYVKSSTESYIPKLTKLISTNYTPDVILNKEVDNVGTWIVDNQELIQDQDLNVGSFIVSEFADGTDKAAYETQLELYKNTILDSELNSEDKIKKLKEQKLQLKNIIQQVSLKNVDKIVEPFFKQGFINSELKPHILNLLNQAKASLDLQEMDLMESGFPTKEQLDSIKSQREKIKGYIERIDNLKHTPIERNLDEFSLSVLGKNTNITELLTKINKELNVSKEDIMQYKSSQETTDEINEALNLIDLYGVALSAMRTDNGDASNIVGYGYTINQVNKRLGTEGYVPIAEIDSQITDAITQDLGILKNKLLFAKKLFALVSGQKLTKQNRVSHNKNLIYYDRLNKFIVNIPDDWKGKSELESVINNCSTLSKYLVPTKDLNVKSEDLKQFEQESIQMADAVYDFFQKNKEVLTDSDKLKEIVGQLNLFEIPSENLTETTGGIDDHSFLTWMAVSAAVKTSAFKKRYSQTVRKLLEGAKPIAPIATQELAIQMNYASCVQGKVLETFIEAGKKATIDNFQKIKDDKDKLKQIFILNEICDSSEAFESLYNSLIKGNEDKILTIFPGLRYSNLSFTEGIPGSGKSQGVYTVTLAMLQTFHPDSDLLQNVYVIHGADKDSEKKSGNKFAKDLGLEEGHYKVLSQQELLENIAPTYKFPVKSSSGRNYTIDEEQLKFDEFGQLRGDVEIKVDSHPASLIVIDELSNFDSITLDIIDKYCKRYGISGLVAGDLDQSGIIGMFKNPLIKDDHIKGDNIAVFRSNFLGTPKLGVTMRTANSCKTYNNHLVSLWKQDDSTKAEFKYFENESGLYGDKIFTCLADSKMSDSDRLLKIQLDGELKESINLMISTLESDESGNKAKIGYVYSDTTSPLFEYLNKPGIKEHIEFFPGTSAQGREGQYYIIEPSQDLDPDSYKQDFYTALTRSQQGSIVVLRGIRNIDKGSTVIPAKNQYGFASIKQNSVVQEGLDKEQVIKFATKQLDIVDELLSDSDDNIEYVKRTPEVIETEEKTEEETGEKTEEETPEETGEEETGEGTEEEEGESIGDKVKKLNEKYPSGTTFWYKSGKKVYKNTIDSFIDSGDKKGIELFYLTESGERKKMSLSKFESQASLTEIKEEPKKKEKKKTKKEKKKEVEKIVSFEESEEKSKSRTVKDEKPVRSVTEEIDGKVKIKALAYSFNTFGLGVHVGSDGKPDIREKDRHDVRIDLINGLMKIPGLENKSIQEYTNILSEIRSIILSTKNRTDIASKIESVINHHVSEDKKLSNLNIDFYLKSSPRPNERERKAGKKWGANNVSGFGKFDEDITEEVIGLRTSGDRGREMPRKKIVMQVSTSTNNILEIPILSLSNPLSIIESYLNNEEYKEVTDLFIESSTKFPDDNEKRTNDFLTKMKSKNLYNKHKDLCNLFELYLETKGDIFEITDGRGKIDKSWTPAKNLKNKGPQIIARETGVIYEQEGYETCAEYITIDQIGVDPVTGIKNSSVKVSPIMYSESGKYQKSDGTFATNEDGSEYIFQSGHPFVLVSYDKNLNSNLLAREYIKQLENPDLPKTVKLVYVVAPRVSIKDYIKNLHEVCKGINKYALLNIGNDFTTYNIVKRLFFNEDGSSNTDFLNFAKSNISDWDKYADDILNLVKEVMNEEVDSDDPDVQWAAYKNQLDKLNDSFQNDKLAAKETKFKYALSNFIHHITYKINGKPNTKVIDYIETALGDYSIKYQSRPYEDRRTQGPFYLVDADNYSIVDPSGNSKPYTIFGQIDSDTFEVELSDFLPKLRKVDSSYKLAKYVNNEYNVSTKPSEEKPVTKSQQTLEALKNNVKWGDFVKTVISKYPSRLEAKDYLQYIVKEINKSTDSRAFLSGDNITIIESIPEELNSYRVVKYDGLDVTFTDPTTGKSITAIYNSSQIEIPIVTEKTISKETAPIQEDIMDQYLEKLPEVLDILVVPGIDTTNVYEAIIEAAKQCAMDPIQLIDLFSDLDPVTQDIANRIAEQIEFNESLEGKEKTVCETKIYKASITTI